MHAAIALPVASAVAQEALPAAGRVHCVVFAGERMQQLSGATVTVSSGEAAVTDRRGSAFLSAPPGRHSVRVEVPRDMLPEAPEDGAAGVAFEIAEVAVVAGDVTRVLLTLSAKGKLLDADVRAPPAASELPAQQPPAQAPAASGAAAQPTPSGANGRISGRVASTEGGTPIAGANVYVLGQPVEAQTGPDGRYQVDVPEGAHTLSVVHIDFIGQTLEGVSVSAGVESQLDVQLAPAPVDMADYLVKARRIRGSVATVMEERRGAASVTDAIGAEDIRKSPDGTASAATRRVVGATVVGGQFLFVRGLGGRYSNVRLNSVPLPSTDPDLPGFQLDLFPASLLSSLTIAKTFTPDIPGDFAGGSMNIATRDFPDHFEVTSSLSLSSDTQTLGRDMQSYDGGGLDFLGFDDGTRALPDQVPDDQVVNRRPSVGEPIDPEQAAEIGESFPNRWALTSRTAPPSLGLGFSIGDTARIGERRFGYLLTLGYRYGSTRYRETVILPTQNTEDDGPAIVATGEPLDRTIGKESAQIGLLGTASYELAAGHDLTAVSVLTQTGDDEASLVTSEFSVNEGGPIRQTELTFIERQLFFNQLIGAHDLTALQLDWQVNVATVQREQPDTRGLIFVENMASDTGFAFSNTSGSGERFYTDLAQTDLGGGADLTLPIDRSRLKSGYLGRLSDRDFSGRRFENNVARSADGRQDAEDIFVPEDSGDVWLLNELTTPEDGYTADQELHAGYALADVPVASWLRLNGGARLESFHQTITVDPPVASLREGEPESTERTDTDPLPAGSAIFSFGDEMSVRMAYGGTVARPLVRELAPFRVQDFIRRRTVQGDPDLQRTYIHNFDVRWELFPSQTEVFAASVFYKVFLDPIEAVVPEIHSLTYANIESARNYGVELEARVTLDRLSDALKTLVVTANFAWIESQITMTDEQRMQATSARRPLAGQSPYVANLSLGYGVPDTKLSLNLFYNVFGRRILEVGRNGLPDAYEEPFHSLDFTASYQLDDHWTLGASATNLLLQEAVVNQGGLDTSRIDRGTSFGVRLGFAN